MEDSSEPCSRYEVDLRHSIFCSREGYDAMHMYVLCLIWAELKVVYLFLLLTTGICAIFRGYEGNVAVRRDAESREKGLLLRCMLRQEGRDVCVVAAVF